MAKIDLSGGRKTNMDEALLSDALADWKRSYKDVFEMFEYMCEPWIDELVECGAITEGNRQSGRRLFETILLHSLLLFRPRLESKSTPARQFKRYFRTGILGKYKNLEYAVRQKRRERREERQGKAASLIS